MDSEQHDPVVYNPLQPGCCMYGFENGDETDALLQTLWFEEASDVSNSEDEFKCVIREIRTCVESNVGRTHASYRR